LFVSARHGGQEIGKRTRQERPKFKVAVWLSGHGPQKQKQPGLSTRPSRNSNPYSETRIGWGIPPRAVSRTRQHPLALLCMGLFSRFLFWPCRRRCDRRLQPAF